MRRSGKPNASGEDGERDGSDLASLVVAVVLVLVCTGVLTGVAAATGCAPSGGSGSLTVQVTDQNGNIQSGQDVTITDDVTGEQRTGTTDQNGKVTFIDIAQGGYAITAGDKRTQTNLDSASKQVSTQIDVSPPKSNGPPPVADTSTKLRSFSRSSPRFPSGLRAETVHGVLRQYMWRNAEEHS